MAVSSFNTLVILDSLNTDDLETAKQLHEQLLPVIEFYGDTPGVELHRVCNEVDLFNVLSDLDQRIKVGLQPILHIECHGYKDGFVLADGTLVSWKSLIVKLTPLNQAMNLNLILVMASCYGGRFPFEMNIYERSPVCGILGPKKEIGEKQLGSDFCHFYTTLFETGSTADAIAALSENNQGEAYYFTSAEKLFYEAWKAYKRTYCTIDELYSRTRLIYEQGRWGTSHSFHNVEQFMRDHEPIYFEKCRNTFFMCDLVAEHVDRFPVTYAEAERHASE